MNSKLIYPREGDKQIVYLKSVVDDPNIIVGDYSMYNDFYNNPCDFQKNNVLYHYPVNGDKLIIGKYCSIACGAKFIFTSANHSQKSLSTYPFPIFFLRMGLDIKEIVKA
jgi:virginiamycin A acetyltransferase